MNTKTSIANLLTVLDQLLFAAEDLYNDSRQPCRVTTFSI